MDDNSNMSGSYDPENSDELDDNCSEADLDDDLSDDYGHRQSMDDTEVDSAT